MSFICVIANHPPNVFCETFRIWQNCECLSHFLQYEAGCHFSTSVLPQLSESSSHHRQRLYIYVKQIEILVDWKRCVHAGFVPFPCFFPVPHTFNNSQKLLQSVWKKSPRAKTKLGTFQPPRWMLLKIMSIWIQFWNLNCGTFDQVSFLQYTFVFITSNFILV